jgi:hypothetical protein
MAEVHLLLELVLRLQSRLFRLEEASRC